MHRAVSLHFLRIASLGSPFPHFPFPIARNTIIKSPAPGTRSRKRSRRGSPRQLHQSSRPSLPTTSATLAWRATLEVGHQWIGVGVCLLLLLLLLFFFGGGVSGHPQRPDPSSLCISRCPRSDLFVIELNPFLETTDAALFHWKHDEAIIMGDEAFEFRINTRVPGGLLWLVRWRFYELCSL